MTLTPIKKTVKAWEWKDALRRGSISHRKTVRIFFKGINKKGKITSLELNP
jgi:hypothetical protein